MKKLLLGFLVVAGMVFLSEPARAHVFIMDSTRQNGAVLHVSPDDDPIAGETSTFFFDFRGESASENTHYFSLSVIDNTELSRNLPLIVHGTSISSAYTFPTQGVYRLSLSAQPKNISGSASVYIHTQRVSRGILGDLEQPAHPWAEFGIAGSLSGLLGLAIVGFNRRKLILRYSRM